MTPGKAIPPHQGIALLFVALLLTASFSTMVGCQGEQAAPAEEEAPQEAVQPVSDPVASGRASYEAYCMSCHGPEGKGNGEIVDELTTLPGDLTQLTSFYDGKFPEDKIYAMVEGNQVVEAHGTREMPVWGNIWSDEPDEVVERRINEIVEYVRSIQE